MLYGVILAAGASTRYNYKIKKQFIKIKDKPIFEYSVEKFLKIKEIDKILLVISKNDIRSNIIKSFLKKYNNYILKNKITLVVGGKERYHSVYNAISYINESSNIKNDDYIIIHDSARPNTNVNDIKTLIKNLKKYKAISLSYKINDTIKKIAKESKSINTIIKTINRDEYILMSTPQGFNLKILYNAYNRFINQSNKDIITDDLQIIEKYTKIKPRAILCSQPNIKITTKNDLSVLKYLL